MREVATENEPLPLGRSLLPRRVAPVAAVVVVSLCAAAASLGEAGSFFPLRCCVLLPVAWSGAVLPVPAPVVGVSRVIAGAHFLHDVGLGALIAGAGLFVHVGGEAWMWNPSPYAYLPRCCTHISRLVHVLCVCGVFLGVLIVCYTPRIQKREGRVSFAMADV